MIQYRPSGGGGRYKKTYFGDGGAAARKEKANRELNALRDQSNQYQAVNQQYLGDVKQVHQLEAQNKAELKQHEDSKFNTRRNATAIKGQRDVEHIRGKAAEYGKAAQFWKVWTPTLAKGLSDNATSLNELAEIRIKYDLITGNLNLILGFLFFLIGLHNLLYISSMTSKGIFCLNQVTLLS